LSHSCRFLLNRHFGGGGPEIFQPGRRFSANNSPDI
jgi:hypothetical protein